jgi:hypothetical protein
MVMGGGRIIVDYSECRYADDLAENGKYLKLFAGEPGPFECGNKSKI